ncbi:hypothetical protein SHIRM173S_05580 [Streptomyces hirsutus]
MQAEGGRGRGRGDTPRRSGPAGASGVTSGSPAAAAAPAGRRPGTRRRHNNGRPPAARGDEPRGARNRSRAPGGRGFTRSPGTQDRRTSSRTPMPYLRAPAGPPSRTDRRGGGMHGRPPARPALAYPEAQIRPQLLRLAVLPPVAVALSASAAVLFLVRSTGVRPGATLWGVLGGAVSVTLAGIVIAAVAADRAARSVHDRVESLRRSTARREADLRARGHTLRRGDGPPPRTQPGGHPGTPTTSTGSPPTCPGPMTAPSPPSSRRPSSPARRAASRSSRCSSTLPGVCSPWCTARSPSSTRWRTRSRTPTCSRASSTSTISPPASAGTPRTSPCSAGPSPGGSGATRSP